MTEAKEMVGDNLAGNSQMYLGPGGFVSSFGALIALLVVLQLHDTS